VINFIILATTIRPTQAVISKWWCGCVDWWKGSREAWSISACHWAHPAWLVTSTSTSFSAAPSKLRHTDWRSLCFRSKSIHSLRQTHFFGGGS